MKPFLRTTFLLCLMTLLSFAVSAQEEKKNDSIRILKQETPAGFGTLQPDAAKIETPKVLIYRPLVPAISSQYLYQPLSDFKRTESLPANVSIGGYGRDYFNNSERTAVFSVTPARNLSFYTAGTLGVYKTLPFHNIHYYNVDVGAAFAIHPSLGGNAGVFYQSNLQMPMPMAGAYLNLNYQATDRLQLNGGLSYRNLQLPQFNVGQQSVMLNTHVRYQLAEDWYLNGYAGTPLYQNSGRPDAGMHPMMPQQYYGGTVEYWFNPTMGAEAGMVWIRDMFSGKMRPQPKIELKFRPGR